MTASADEPRLSPSGVRPKFAVLLFALAFPAAGAVWLSLSSAPAVPQASAAPPVVAAAPVGAVPEPVATAPRRIYRHSVIPGGVRSREELAQAIRSDKVVAAHYAGFKVEDARALIVSKPRAVYVSYRKDGQIFWTRHKVMLEAGEMLLTDGDNEVRARCANRLSDVARLPVADQDPSLELLNAGSEDDAANGTMQNLSAPDSDADAEHGGQSASLVTFADGAGLVPAERADGSAVALAPFAVPPLEDRFLGRVTGGSTFQLSTGLAGSAGGASSQPPASAPLPGPDVGPDATPAIDLLPLLTPTLPATPLPDPDTELPVPVTTPGAPPSPPTPRPSSKPLTPPADTPTGGGFDETIPVPGKDMPPPFDPERPMLWPPQEPPATTDRQLPHGEVPEPGTFWLIGAALMLLVWRRRAPRRAAP